MTTEWPRSYLREVYENHNARRGAGFVYGGEERVRVMRRLVPADSQRILDVGCRDGTLAQCLGLTKEFIVGLDIDGVSLSNAKELRRLIPCLGDLSRRLPFRPESFDLALAGEVLEHLPFPDQLCGQIAQLLKPQGSLVGSVPNAFKLKNRLSFLAGFHFEMDPTHLRQFSIRTLKEMLQRFFERVEIYPCVGRYVGLAPALLGNDLVWRATGPKSGAPALQDPSRQHIGGASSAAG